MNQIKQCNNGHFYREDVVKCPICSEKEVQDSYIEEKYFLLMGERPSEGFLRNILILISSF